MRIVKRTASNCSIYDNDVIRYTCVYTKYKATVNDGWGAARTQLSEEGLFW